MSRYAPYYCEENVWWLAQEPHWVDPSVVVVTNPSRTVAMSAQRASKDGTPVVWDYHVVLLDRGAVWDLDCVLGMPLPARRWIEASFDSRAPAHLAPRFRVLARETYVARFASDRRHMRRPDGSWLVDPPPWPAIGGAHDLERLLDLDDPSYGAWLDLLDFTSRATRPLRPQ